jgi:N-acetylgalactosamine-N,N'-diacetylbacillosaminyl-diphospho-undecaprenol 4-alpha-N-acetylgalactosaminyltransferase
MQFQSVSQKNRVAQPVSRKKRVAFVINSLCFGGAERVMTTLLRASIDEASEFELELFLLDDVPIEYPVPSWLRVRQFNCRLSMVKSLFALKRGIREFAPDVILSFLTRANIAAVILGRLCGVPVIISERVNTSSHLGGGLMAGLVKTLVRWTYPRAAKIIAVSSGVADDLVAAFDVPEDKIVVIANPIDVESIVEAAAGKSAEVSDGEPYVVAMGRLVPNKNFALLIEAFARSGIGGRLVILGDGDERENLVKLIRERGLEGSVELLGFSSNPFPVLRQARFFVLPSNAEGFPNALLEAMSVGLPVISTNCLSGPSEVLADMARDDVPQPIFFAEHGIIVSTNAPDALAEAMRALIDQNRRDHYAAKAQARALAYSVGRAKERYWSVLRSFLPA